MKSRKLLLAATLFELVGLVTGVTCVAAFGRITMLVFFGVGLPALLLGMGLYLVVVIRTLIARGAL